MLPEVHAYQEMSFCESSWWFIVASKFVSLVRMQSVLINDSENGKITRVEEFYCNGLRTRAPPPGPIPAVKIEQTVG